MHSELLFMNILNLKAYKLLCNFNARDITINFLVGGGLNKVAWFNTSILFRHFQ